jgi:lactoylglutathione lyase
VKSGNGTTGVWDDVRPRASSGTSFDGREGIRQDAGMRYLHSMIRVRDLDASLDFFCNKLGLKEVRRHEVPQGRYTLVFLGAPDNPDVHVELTHNWDPEDYGSARNFGHLAYEVENVYETCQRLMDAGVTINRPPRDGYMAFVRSPDLISVELLQRGEPLAPQEPWASMPNVGEW